MRVLCRCFAAPSALKAAEWPQKVPRGGIGFAESYAEVYAEDFSLMRSFMRSQDPFIRLCCRFCLMRLMGISKKSYGEKLVSRVLSYAGSYAPMPIRPNEFFLVEFFFCSI